MWRKKWRMSVHRWKSKFTPAGGRHYTTEMISHFITCQGKRTHCSSETILTVMSNIGWKVLRNDLKPFIVVVRLPDVYTQFRKAVETQSRVRPEFPTPEQLKPLPSGLDEGAIPTAEDLQQTGEHWLSYWLNLSSLIHIVSQTLTFSFSVTL